MGKLLCQNVWGTGWNRMLNYSHIKSVYGPNLIGCRVADQSEKHEKIAKNSVKYNRKKYNFFASYCSVRICTSGQYFFPAKELMITYQQSWFRILILVSTPLLHNHVYISSTYHGMKTNSMFRFAFMKRTDLNTRSVRCFTLSRKETTSHIESIHDFSFVHSHDYQR